MFEKGDRRDSHEVSCIPSLSSLQQESPRPASAKKAAAPPKATSAPAETVKPAAPKAAPAPQPQQAGKAVEEVRGKDKKPETPLSPQPQKAPAQPVVTQAGGEGSVANR